MKRIQLCHAPIACLILLALLLPGCGAAGTKAAAATLYASTSPAITNSVTPAQASPSRTPLPAATTQPAESAEPQETGIQPAAALKYVFLFIGDGMSFAQVKAAQKFASQSQGKSLAFAAFPIQGSAKTDDARSAVTDSAAAATALACGEKTRNGVLGLASNKKTKLTSIAYRMRDAGWKIGIVSSVTLNHATPAAFYAHSAGRDEYYDIALQMARSGFDYFGGGALLEPRDKSGKKRSVYDILADQGYRIADTKTGILALDGSSGKVYARSPALQDSGSLPYALDAAEGSLSLADFVAKGIDVIDNETGFFMMCESGKIDWACQTHDAAGAVGEVMALSRAVQTALDFAALHPGEVLILVTGDHETGGMAVSSTEDIGALKRQTVSREAFWERFRQFKADKPRLALADVMPLMEECFGLADLNADEIAQLNAAFSQSMKPAKKRRNNAETQRLYGSYDPFTQTLLHIVSARAGIDWKKYSHTGAKVPVYAWGAGADAFSGDYENTDICRKLMEICLK